MELVVFFKEHFYFVTDNCTMFYIFTRHISPHHSTLRFAKLKWSGGGFFNVIKYTLDIPYKNIIYVENILATIV